jgi:hypothetical protein
MMSRAQHQRGVDEVLTGQAAAQPRRSVIMAGRAQPLRQQRD